MQDWMGGLLFELCWWRWQLAGLARCLCSILLWLINFAVDGVQGVSAGAAPAPAAPSPAPGSAAHAPGMLLCISVQATWVTMVAEVRCRVRGRTMVGVLNPARIRRRVMVVFWAFLPCSH